MTRRNLILVHRGQNHDRDFEEIAEKTHELDRNITVFSVPAGLEATIPDAEWRYPTLTVATLAKFKLPVRRGPILKNHQIAKLAQQDIFRKHGIPTPPALPFTFGMALDPIVFGEFVVVKPADLKLTSHGNFVFLFRRSRLCGLEPRDLPDDHPVRLSPHSFLVQKYIHTGTQPLHIRVGTFFAKAFFSFSRESKYQMPPLDASDHLLEQTPVASNVGERTRRLVIDSETVRLAEAVHSAFGPIPLLGIDIIREHASGKLYVLEANPGGNTWVFASRIGESVRVDIGASKGPGSDANAQGRLAFIEQFGAFDIVAKALVEKTRELAA